MEGAAASRQVASGAQTLGEHRGHHAASLRQLTCGAGPRPGPAPGRGDKVCAESLDTGAEERSASLGSPSLGTQFWGFAQFAKVSLENAGDLNFCLARPCLAPRDTPTEVTA